MAWFTLSNFRPILTTETDADSGATEELMSQLRENIECLLMLMFGTGVTGSATEDPPNDTTGVLTDSARSWDVDVHNGRTLVITSGLAAGFCYTIDDTTATTLVCTGDNLYADGVRSGDTYMIFHDIKNNADGHNHDGVNSAELQLAAGVSVPGIWSPATDNGSDNEYTHNSSSTWKTCLAGYVYIPTSAPNITFAARLHCDGTYYAQCRFTVGSATTTIQRGGLTYGWVTGTVDVSAETGWVAWSIDIKSNSNNAISYLAGFSSAYSPS